MGSQAVKRPASVILQRTDLGVPLSTLSPWLDMLTRAR